jgi:predicted nucleotidyltransferase
MHSIITNNADKIREACDRHHVQSLFAFGSVCTDKFNDASDIDFLVAFKPLNPADYADNYFQIAELLERILLRPVDLITDKSLKNPYFIRSINQTKTLIYGQ